MLTNTLSKKSNLNLCGPESFVLAVLLDELSLRSLAAIINRLSLNTCTEKVAGSD